MTSSDIQNRVSSTLPTVESEKTDGTVLSYAGSLDVDLDGDYTLNENANSVWITVGDISVHVLRHDDRVAVALYSRQHEDEDALAETHLCFCEAAELDEDDE